MEDISNNILNFDKIRLIIKVDNIFARIINLEKIRNLEIIRVY